MSTTGPVTRAMRPTPATAALVALLVDQVALLADESIEALVDLEELRRLGFA